MACQALLWICVYFCFINALNFAQCIAEECLQEVWHHFLRVKGASKYSDLQLEVVLCPLSYMDSTRLLGDP